MAVRFDPNPTPPEGPTWTHAPVTTHHRAYVYTSDGLIHDMEYVEYVCLDYANGLVSVVLKDKSCPPQQKCCNGMQ